VDLMVMGGGLPLGEVAIGGDDVVDVAVGTERAEDDADEADGGGEAEAIARRSHGWRGGYTTGAWRLQWNVIRWIRHGKRIEAANSMDRRFCDRLGDEWRGEGGLEG